MAYLNADGLYKKIGTEKAVASRAGEYKTYGNMRDLVVDITFGNGTTNTLGTSSVIQSDVLFLPTSVRIEEVEVVTLVAEVGGTPTLDVGVINTDRSTVPSSPGAGATAILAAYPNASLAALGTKNVIRLGGTGAGTWVGLTTPTTNPNYITAKMSTTAATAGSVRVIIRYSKL